MTIFRPFQGNVQGIIVDGLGDKVRRVQLERTDGHIHFAKRGGHDHFRFRESFFDGLKHLNAIHARHSDICDHDLGRNLLAQFQTRHTVRCGGYLISGIRETDAHNLSNAFLIINQNNFPLMGICHIKTFDG